LSHRCLEPSWSTCDKSGRQAGCVFGLARIAGWLAHATEKYCERPLRYRPHSTYIGP